MRTVISGSGLLIICALIMLSHCMIINNSIRREEVNQSLDSSMDYAYDVMRDMYGDVNFTKYADEQREELINQLMNKFCEVLSKRVKSDGKLTVKLIECDLESGLFQIGVMEEFRVPLSRKKNACYYEKTYVMV